MDLSNAVSFIWEFMGRDVSLGGGLHSPLLSWLGSCGIILFFLWHVGTLLRKVASTRQCFTRILPDLTSLAKDRRTSDEDWLVNKAKATVDRKRIRYYNPNPIRTDINDVRRLDTTLQQEPLFQRPWTQFRKTLLVERVPWFIEPRISSTCPAEEFFSQESLLTSRLNLGFYNQLPSLITGFGLLLTFMAILIGLSKLHADGSHIEGIQGLINGLAGKFLTSIVGLICANAFALIENPLVFRLTTIHQQFLDMMDEMFPRKTMEQMLEDLTLPGKQDGENTPTASTADFSDRFTSTISDRLSPSLAALTTAVQSLTRWKQEDQATAQQQLTAQFARTIQEGIEPSIKELNQAIHNLTRSLGGIQAPQEYSKANLDQLFAQLTQNLNSLPVGADSSPSGEPARSLSWYRSWRQRASGKDSG